jgi:hypothetical protein
VVVVVGSSVVVVGSSVVVVGSSVVVVGAADTIIPIEDAYPVPLIFTARLVSVYDPADGKL